MGKINLHPSVIEFKKFVNKHPELIKEIRRSGKTWQEYYEKWALLGEEDSLWDEYKHTEEINKDSENEHFDLLTELIQLKDKLDFNNIQKNIVKLSDTIEIVQAFLGDEIKSNQVPGSTGAKNSSLDWFRD